MENSSYIVTDIAAQSEHVRASTRRRDRETRQSINTEQKEAYLARRRQNYRARIARQANQPRQTTHVSPDQVEQLRARTRTRERERRQAMSMEQRETYLARRRQNYHARKSRLANEQGRNEQSAAGGVDMPLNINTVVEPHSTPTPVHTNSITFNPNRSSTVFDEATGSSAGGGIVGRSYLTPLLNTNFSSSSANQFEASSSRATASNTFGGGTVGRNCLTPLLNTNFSSFSANQFEASSSRATASNTVGGGIVGRSCLTPLLNTNFSSSSANQFEASSSRATASNTGHQTNAQTNDAQVSNFRCDEEHNNRRRTSRYHNIARSHNENQGIHRFKLPDPTICWYCQAMLFDGETPSFCCNTGKISLPEIPVPPELYRLFVDDSVEGRNFRKNIRAINHVFSFTSIGVQLDQSVMTGQGIYAFRAHGSIYHRIGTLLPPPGIRPRYIQMFIYDTEHETGNRLLECGDLSSELIEKIKQILDAYNPFVKTFRQLAQRPDLPYCKLLIKERPTTDRQYVLPTASQVAAIISVDDDLVSATNRDIIIETNGGQLMSIKEFSGYYDPLQYPLFLPYGTYGWDTNTRTARNIKVTCCDYYAYMLQIRGDNTSVLLYGGRLFQQYVVDNYVKVETQKLRYIRFNQDKIRAELYQGLQDSLNDGENIAGNVGRRIVLPSSFIGSPRDMYQRYQDAMAVVRKYGKPDIFLTMTCNANWIEIQEQLFPGQTAQDRPDLLTRVFRAKYENLKKDIYKRGVLGKVVAHVHVIEFQKRGLPHSHLLIILHEDDKLNSPDDYDQVVRAELPDKDEEPLLYAAVLRHMIHGPCGLMNQNSPCMKEGCCDKDYPKQFAPCTSRGNNSYPVYRRRDDGRSIPLDRTGDKVIDNRWVVPYNPWLLLEYDCHINVEICSSITSIKYLYKYVYKGPDCVSFEVRSGLNYDELNQYVDGRWICAPEALWKMYKYAMSQIYPSVVRLQLHLPNMQQVRFDSQQLISDVLNDERNSRTMLTEFFQVYYEGREEKKFLYTEFPRYYKWIPKEKSWQRRKTKQQVIGRLYAASPNEGERFYLRIMLNHVRGPKSFGDLLTVNGVRYSTFRVAAEKLGVLEEDGSIRQCLIEARIVRMPSALRRLFATILVYCEPTEVRCLWDENYPYMIEDYPSSTTTNSLFVTNKLLHDINNILLHHGRSLKEFDLPQITEGFEDMENISDVIEDELRIPICEDDINAVHKLNAGQTEAFNAIKNAIMRTENVLFFVDGPGGTGKTFLYRALLAFFRNNGLIMIATATSGIAANQLSGGRTAHSKLKIPIKLHAKSMCSFSKQSKMSQLLQRASAIIWDEAPMANKTAIETVDRTLRDIRKVDLPFGGIVMILGGDFRQVVPVVVRGTRAQMVQASIVDSYLWSSVKLLRLTENIRARHDHSFSDFLLRVGNGEEPTLEGEVIKFPDAMVIPWEGEDSIDQLISAIFPQLNSHSRDANYMMHRAIITPRNDEVNKINEKVITSFQVEDEATYYSFDSVADDVNNLFLPEFLNSIAAGNLPPHKLTLKKGCPIMLLRNVDPKIGLCNGTRLICHRFGRNVIDAEILTGEFKGTRVFLPRIPLKSSEDANLPFEMTRKQFPVRLSFALTINKSQGQTIPYVGLYLPDHVFSHGQLYVALSRGVSQATTKVLVRNGKLDGYDGTYTRNVVYPEIFTKLMNNFA